MESLVKRRLLAYRGTRSLSRLSTGERGSLVLVRIGKASVTETLNRLLQRLKQRLSHYRCNVELTLVFKYSNYPLERTEWKL
jgi:hypothetical protein